MKRLYILMLTINIHASYTSHTFDSIPMSSIGSFFYGVLSLPVYGARAIFSIYEELENWKYTSQCAARWAKTYPLQCCLGAFGMGALYNKTKIGAGTCAVIIAIMYRTHVVYLRDHGIPSEPIVIKYKIVGNKLVRID